MRRENFVYGNVVRFRTLARLYRNHFLIIVAANRAVRADNFKAAFRLCLRRPRISKCSPSGFDF